MIKKEKTLLVLGGSSDMGMRLIFDTEKIYSKIIVQYRTESKELLYLKNRIGEKIELIKCDFFNSDEIESMMNYIIDKEFFPDHIVHFAATKLENQRFHKLDWSIFQKEIDVSLKSVVIVLNKFIPIMRKQKYGKIVIMLSQVVNNMPYPNISNYVVAKYALLGLVKSLAVEYAKDGITVNAISPSMVNTKFISEQPDILIRNHSEKSLIGRILECDDVVPSIRFLLSDEADCINGQNVSINCGE